MSFTFKWPRFSDDFHHDARQMLEAALNKGNKPPIIADKIEVVELEMGTQPPELEIRDIGDLTLDQFRGIFRLSYAGDAHIVLRTKVQANPLNHTRPDIHMLGGSPGMLAAHQPLVVPMLLRLSHFKLNAYVVLVVSKQKGITLVFKTDPLQNVDVNSTFDSIAVIQKYIQREIEGQLREMFREDLPGIIHRLSQRWVAGKTKVEAPYLSRPQPLRTTSERFESMSTPDMMAGGLQHPSLMIGVHPALRRQPLSRMQSMPRMQCTGPQSAPTTIGIPSTFPIPPPNISDTSNDPQTTFPEIENFDPTYGLRPDDLPAKSGYSGFGRLFATSKGLGDLAEEQTDDGREWDEADSFDMVDWEETVNFSPPPSVIRREDSPEYEILPAVGGGTITRPRIYHSQSMIRPPTEVGSSSATTLGARTQPNTPSYHPFGLTRPGHDRMLVGSMTGVSTPAHFQNPYFQSWPARPHTLSGDSLDYRLRRAQSTMAPLSGVPPGSSPAGFAQRSLSPDSSFLTSYSGGTGSHPSRSSSIQTGAPFTPPPSDVPYGRPASPTGKAPHQPSRRRSLSPVRPPSDGIPYGSPPNFRSAMDAEGNIVLRPSLNNTISQLSTLSHSNHTLSPYTRSLEHFTVRSVPHRASASFPVPERLPTKAKRKRMYRLGGKKPPDTNEVMVEERAASSSPPPPSEFEASDVDHYFRVAPPSLRRRASYQDF